MGPEGVITAMVAHARALIPEGLNRVRAQRGLTVAQLPPFQQILGYVPQQKTISMFPLLEFNAQDTTGRLDTRRVVDGAEGDLYRRMYRVTARVWVASISEIDTIQALHRYALVARDGLQLRRVLEAVPPGDYAEITARQTQENYSDASEQGGRFVASASFTFYISAEEFLAAVQQPNSPGPVKAVNLNTGAAVAGRDLQGDLLPDGILNASPLIDRMTLGTSPTPGA